MPDIANPFRIGKLTIEPGDTVVVKVSAILSSDQVQHLESYFASRLPEGVKPLIVQRGIDVKVMRKLKLQKIKKRKGR
jgi:hypothetical protein